MPTVQTNGITMNYDERGEGDPVIMIMGITAPGAVWEAHADDWSQHFRCIMPDNRGVGGSDKPAGDYSSEMFADDYAGLMDELGIEKARIVGVSMGSIIAQQLCLRHPGKVRSAVLMCPWARCDRYATSTFEPHEVACKAHLAPKRVHRVDPDADLHQAALGQRRGLPGPARVAAKVSPPIRRRSRSTASRDRPPPASTTTSSPNSEMSRPPASSSAARTTSSPRSGWARKSPPTSRTARPTSTTTPATPSTGRSWTTSTHASASG